MISTLLPGFFCRGHILLVRTVSVNGLCLVIRPMVLQLSLALSVKEEQINIYKLVHYNKHESCFTSIGATRLIVLGL
jgi:hypothetical protein